MERNKHALVEPVVYKGGSMTAAQRNAVYAEHNVPGIGKKSIQSEEVKKHKKVLR